MNGDAGGSGEAVAPVVVYVVGEGRSGSTLLGDLLGQSPGWEHAGELAGVWSKGLVRGHACGCGRPVADCAYWEAVLDRVDLAALGATVTGLAAWQHAHLRTLRTPLLLGRAPTADRRLWTAVHERLIRAVAAEAGARVVVDTTKWPAHLVTLLDSDLDVRVVHLVRHPAEVATSRAGVRPDPGDPRPGATMPTDRPTRTALRWVGRNLTAELVLSRLPRERRVLVRYDDVVARPAEVLRRISELAGEPVDTGVVEGDRVRLAPGHTVSGNPTRFRTGEVRLRRPPASPAPVSPAIRGTRPLAARYGVSQNGRP